MAERRNATETYVATQTGLLVPKSLYDANTILKADSDDTPVALSVPASTFVGRKAAGSIAAMTATEAAALLTDLVPKSLYDANTVLAATTDDTPAALTVGASTFVGRKASGNIAAMTPTEAQALFEMAYNTITTSGTSTQTVQASATTVLTMSSVTFDGSTPVWITFWTQRLSHNIAGVGFVSALVNLWEDSTDLGIIGRISSLGGTGNNIGGTVLCALKRTPTSGAKVYTFRLWITSAGTATVDANSAFPVYGRIERA